MAFKKLFVMLIGTALLCSVAVAATYLHIEAAGQLVISPGFLFITADARTNYTFAANHSVGLLQLTNDTFIVDGLGTSITSPAGYSFINITHLEPGGDSLFRATVQSVGNSTMFFNFSGLPSRIPYQFLVDGQALPISVSVFGAVSFAASANWANTSIELRLVVSALSTLATYIIGIFTLVLIVLIVLFTFVWMVERFNEYKDEARKWKWWFRR